MQDLSKEDWQWVLFACEQRWRAAGAKPGEPPNSKAFKDEQDRIRQFLFGKAYPKADGK